MRKIEINSETLINAILTMTENYKEGWLTKKQYKECIINLYKGNRCQTGDEIQEIVNNSFKKMLG